MDIVAFLGTLGRAVGVLGDGELTRSVDGRCLVVDSIVVIIDGVRDTYTPPTRFMTAGVARRIGAFLRRFAVVVFPVRCILIQLISTIMKKEH